MPTRVSQPASRRGRPRSPHSARGRRHRRDAHGFGHSGRERHHSRRRPRASWRDSRRRRSPPSRRTRGSPTGRTVTFSSSKHERCDGRREHGRRDRRGAGHDVDHRVERGEEQHCGDADGDCGPGGQRDHIAHEVNRLRSALARRHSPQSRRMPVGNTLPGRVITFASSNPGVATINSSTGVATGVAAGTTSITASSGGKTSSHRNTHRFPRPRRKRHDLPNNSIGRQRLLLLPPSPRSRRTRAATCSPAAS